MVHVRKSALEIILTTYWLLLCLLVLPSLTFAQEISSRSNVLPLDVKTEAHEFKTSKIYAVIVGISEYEDSKLRLAFADADARFYYEFLRSPSGGSVPERNISLLLNEKATRANIIKALNTQFRDAFEEDLVIIYIAAHGVPSSRGNQLFFLGADADMNNVEGSAISQREFEEALLSTKAQKRIWTVDACHSGTVVSTEIAIARGAGDKPEASLVHRLLTHMASAEAGYVILSASSAGETSLESSRWGGGHGVFTYYLVEGLKGAADRDKNSLVDIREIYEYVRAKVAEDTQGQQYPLLNGRFSREFPMSVVIK
jgi:uncharacterized caspase-like protein